MKKSKLLVGMAVILAMSTILSGCEVTIKDETDDEYKEKYETLVSELQSGYQEHVDQTYVAATAKTIYTAFAAYLTLMSIDGEEIPDDFNYNNYKDDLYKDGYLTDDIYLNDKLKVEMDYYKGTYSLKYVTVTYENISATYPD